jgi:hypothetical protein
MATLNCQCADPGCTEHKDKHGTCDKPGSTVLVRVDMEDRTGTIMCRGCAYDALDSMVFREDKGLWIKAKVGK